MFEMPMVGPMSQQTIFHPDFRARPFWWEAYAPNADDLIHPGRFVSERLVNMAKHNYKLEPNVTFSPDQKWIIFRSNMHGGTQVYAVEIAK